jgi:hypothetical protein
MRQQQIQAMLQQNAHRDRTGQGEIRVQGADPNLPLKAFSRQALFGEIEMPANQVKPIMHRILKQGARGADPAIGSIAMSHPVLQHTLRKGSCEERLDGREHLISFLRMQQLDSAVFVLQLFSLVVAQQVLPGVGEVDLIGEEVLIKEDSLIPLHRKLEELPGVLSSKGVPIGARLRHLVDIRLHCFFPQEVSRSPLF